MEKFFDSIIKLENKCQIIVGITIKDSDTKSIMGNLPKDIYKLITVKNKAFGKME